MPAFAARHVGRALRALRPVVRDFVSGWTVYLSNDRTSTPPSVTTGALTTGDFVAVSVDRWLPLCPRRRWQDFVPQAVERD